MSRRLSENGKVAERHELLAAGARKQVSAGPERKVVLPAEGRFEDDLGIFAGAADQRVSARTGAQRHKQVDALKAQGEMSRPDHKLYGST